MDISRRDLLKVGLAVAGGAAGCGGADERAGAGGETTDADIGVDDAGGSDGGFATAETGLGSDSAPDDARIEVDAPAEAAPPPPTPDQLLAPIDTFVVLCMENRSFDHYLGARKLLEQAAVDGLSPTMSNPDAAGRPVTVHPLDRYAVADPPHDWDPVHAQWNSGAMDGFIRANGDAPTPEDVMGYYGRADLPVTWAMADQFVVCERWFSSLLGPTWPNRFFLHGATSNGITDNTPSLGFDSIFSRLEDAGKTHKNYFSDVAWALGGYLKIDTTPVEEFFNDAAFGTLPNFSLIDPQFFGAGATDDHPDHDVRLGQAFIGSVYAALRASPQWNRCLLVVTYDEHGGFFDHVPPPAVTDEREEFRRLGVRVPTLVAGPTVRRGQTVSTVFDHVSIIATLTRRFGLQPMNARALATADLSSCIDPVLLDHPRPGAALPAAPAVDMAALAAADARLRGRPPTHHAELWNAVERGRFPAALDRRGQSLAITRRWLAAGQRLGALTTYRPVPRLMPRSSIQR